MKPKLKVGDKLIARETFSHPTQHEVYEVTVSKVGRVYFELQKPYPDRSYLLGRFLTENWRWAHFNNIINRPVHLFQSLEEMEQWIKNDQRKTDLHKWWTHSYSTLDKLTHTQVSQIHDIVFPK